MHGAVVGVFVVLRLVVFVGFVPGLNLGVVESGLVVLVGVGVAGCHWRGVVGSAEGVEKVEVVGWLYLVGVVVLSVEVVGCFLCFVEVYLEGVLGVGSLYFRLWSLGGCWG